MAINPIVPNPITVGPIAPAISSPAATASQDAAGNFVNMLQHALGELNDLAKNADGMAAKAATGEDVDLHEVMLAMESAGLGFQLAMQVRNKLIDAYQEITRMQV